MKTNARERITILVGVVIVVAILLYNVLSPPAASGQKTPLLSVDEAHKRHKASVAELKKLVKQQNEVQDQMLSLVSKRAPDEIIPRVIRDLQRIAKQANIQLTEVKPQRARALSSSKLEKVSIDVRFRATFQPNVMQFFYLLEAPEGKMVIDKFSVNSADARLKTVDVSAQISVYTRAVMSANGGDTTNVSKP